jgi:hypothetical protein
MASENVQKSLDHQYHVADFIGAVKQIQNMALF